LSLHEPEEVTGSPIRINGWLDHLPYVFDPNAQQEDNVANERRLNYLKKIQPICRSEVDGILAFALNSIKYSQDANPRQYERLRASWRNGNLVPKTCDIDSRLQTIFFETVLSPMHNLEVHHYLHVHSDSLLTDLATVFGVAMTESKIEDPNPIFNKLLLGLQEAMQPFLCGYKPYELIDFPFIVCIAGPQSSGRTTVAQFIKKSFNVHIIECKPNPDYKGSAKGKTSSLDAGDESMDEPPVEFPLTDSIQIKYSDDKTCVNEIIAAIKNNAEDGFGFIICGYPNQKNQYQILEKAMLAAGATLHARQLQFLPPLSARSRAQLPAINGMIFNVYTDPIRDRLVDPNTGVIYKKGFYMPGITDLLGVEPRDFLEGRRKIESRLIGYTDDEYPILGAKALLPYGQFEAIVKKTIPTVTIGMCDSVIPVLQAVDTFMVELYQKNPTALPNQTPLITLLKPLTLVKPGKCFTGIATWYACLESFGRTIADQSNLVSTLASKVDVLMKAATDRYQLLISQRDQRLRLCRMFHNQTDKNWSEHFRVIWELSIAIRNQNLELIDDVIDTSGLIELLIELRKSSRIVFISLLHRLIYVKWFSERFSYLIGNAPLEPFEKFEVLTAVEIPKVNYAISMEVEAEVCILPGARGAVQRTFHYLMGNLKLKTERPPDSTFVDTAQTCLDLCIPPFARDTIDFQDTIPYAEAFFNHVDQNCPDKLLKQEVKSAKSIFLQFTSICQRKESSMVNSVFELKDSLTKYAYAKCTHEMELFSTRFREAKQGVLPAGVESFEFDIVSVNPRVRSLAESLVTKGTPIVIQSLVSFKTIVLIANEIRDKEMRFARAEEFLEAVAGLNVSSNEQEELELALRVMECVECFDVHKFLLCFPRTRDEEGILRRTFATKRLAKIFTSTVSMTQNTVAESPEEDLDERTEIQIELDD
jgi:hypothetical protein